MAGVFLKAYRSPRDVRGDARSDLFIGSRETCSLPASGSCRRGLSERLADRARPVGIGSNTTRRSPRVREAVARLPEKQRATLILKVYQDLTHEEVAGILGSSVGTVKANLFHALANLRKALGQEA